jgi:type VI secretion system protein ImpF
MSRRMAGAYAPLFDRLTGLNEGAVDGVLLDGGRLRLSLVRELNRLLNTTSPLGLEAFEQADCTVIDYGLPDFRTLSAQSSTDLNRLAALISKAIAAFEPRMSQVQVRMQQDPRNPMHALAHLQAVVRLGDQLRRVDFEWAVSPGSGAVLKDN